MRIRGLDEETEQDLENYEELKGKIADLTKTAKTPGGVSLFADKDKTEFKSTYQFLKDISEIYHDLTDKQQAELLEVIAGKRGGQVLAGILDDFSSVEDALRVMSESAGNADKELGIVEKSISFKLNKLKQEWISIAQSAIDRGTVGGILDFLSGVSSGLGNIISQIGTLNTLIISLGTIFGSKLGLFDFDENGLAFHGVNFKDAKENKKSINQFSEIKNNLLNFTDKTAVVPGLDTMLGNIDDATKKVKELSDEWKTGGKTIEEAIDDIDVEIGNLGKGTSGLKNLFKGVVQSVISGGLNLAVSAAIAGTISGAKWLYDEVLTNNAELKRREEAVHALSESIEKYNQEADAVDTTIQKYEELRRKLNDVNRDTQEYIDIKGQLLDVQNSLYDTFGSEASGLDLVNGSYEEQLTLLREIKKEKAYDFLYNPETGVISNTDHGKSTFQRNLDVINERISGGSFELGFGEDKTLDEIYGFELESILSSAKGIKFVKKSSYDYGTGSYLDEFKDYSLELDPNLTKEAANTILEDVFKALRRANPNNKDVEEFISDVRRYYGLDDYDAVMTAESHANVDETFKNWLLYNSEDGKTPLDDLSKAISDYNSALTELETDGSEKARAKFEEAKTQLNEARDAAMQLRDDALITSYEGGQEEYENMVDKMLDKVLPTEEEKIEKFFNDAFGDEKVPDVTIKINADTEEYQREIAKIGDFGLGKYANQIISGQIDSKFGNIDMNNRQIIAYNDEYLKDHKEALQSWFDYDEDGKYIGTYYDYLKDAVQKGETVIDTVFGGSDSFSKNGQEYEIAFSPILQTENGGVFLSKQNVDAYINSILEEAAKDGIISEEEIFELDAHGIGFQVGDNFVHGLIAGVNSSGNQNGIEASIVGALMHFLGKYGALNIAKNGGTAVKYQRNDDLKTYAIQKRAELSDEAQHIFTKSLLDSQAYVLTMEDIDKLCEDAQKKADEKPVTIETRVGAVDAVDSMADAKSAFDSLKALYDQTVNMTPADGQATGFADPALLNNIETSFSKFITEGSDGTKKLNDALIGLEETMVREPNNANAARDAINNVVTAYIDETEIIKNLTEENKEWSIAQLQAMNIENAKEVVETRLIKTSKKISEAMAKTTSAYKKNKAALSDSKNGTKEYNDALEELIPNVQDMLSVYNDDGSVAFVPELNSGFIEENLEDINLAAEGNMLALNRLQAKIAEIRAEQILVEAHIPTQAAEMQANQIMDMVYQANAMNIEVGASIDDSAFLSGLSNMMSSSQATADAVIAAFESMGYTVDWQPKSYKTKLINSLEHVPASVAEQIKANYGDGSLDFTVPELTIKRRTTGGGSQAHYVPTTTPSTSGGGGGGGGGSESEPNKPKEEAAETYDWVAKYIQRLEEAEERLSKVVGNTYTTWSKRNIALVGELANVEEQIEANKVANEEYQRYMNSIKINDGKGLNDDDYGENDELIKAEDQRLLDEAIALWDTGIYQTKVIQGMLSGDDIEKISNKYLRAAIAEYDEYFQKAVDTNDKVQDLIIKQGELWNTMFDNIKSEYEGLMSLVQAKADIIDARIARSEEHGYFVDKTYYDDLFAYQQNLNNKLKSEYEDLIKKRDEGVAKGYIEEGSEAWVQMTNDIDAANQALEEGVTKLIEYRNAQRQIDWDIFDFTRERVQDELIDEAAFLQELMANDKLYEDDGRLTNLGETTNGLYALQYGTYMKEAEEYAKEYQKAKQDLASDPADKEMINRVAELRDNWQEAIKNVESMKDAVKSLVEEAFNKNIAALDKIISEYEEAMDKAKSLYSYQKNIENQTKNIANLERLVNAYSGNDTEEVRKLRQQAANSLEQARQQLEETEWDHAIDETKKILTKLRDEYEETLMAKLEDVDQLMIEMMAHADGNAKTIVDALTGESNSVGYVINEKFTSLLSNFENGGTIDSTKTAVESINTAVDQIAYDTRRFVDGEAGTVLASFDKSIEDDSGTAQGQKTAVDEINDSVKKIADIMEKGDAPSPSNKVDAVRDIMYDYQSTGKVDVNSVKALLGLNAYAKGSSHIPHNEIAWTQENGSELIYRTSDGAMLTPLGAGDMVFTNDMSKRLWELAKGDYQALTGNTSKPVIASNVGNTFNNQNEITIELPNVKNYDEFKSAMKKDAQFANFVQEITLGQALGRNTLRKNNY